MKPLIFAGIVVAAWAGVVAVGGGALMIAVGLRGRED